MPCYLIIVYVRSLEDILGQIMSVYGRFVQVTSG
jgi:hypothetical protein